MSQVRALAERVRRLEQLRARPSPFEVRYGSLDAFEAETRQSIEAARLDKDDMPLVLDCIRRWHADSVWRSWTKHDQNWRLG